MIRTARRLVFGITAHGLGHLTRTVQLANRLFAADQSLEFHFWTDIPQQRLASELVMPFHYRRVAYEPGTSQKNCFELDVNQTVREYKAFAERADSMLANEIDALRAVQCDAIVSDAPAILVRAAAVLGIRAIAVCNFTWDWILEPILVDTPAEPMLGWLEESYASGFHHLRLPFGPNTSPFPSAERAPLISRRSDADPEEVARRLDLERGWDRPIALVCPGGWDPEGWERIRPDTRDFQLVLVGDLPVESGRGDLSLPHELEAGLSFPDLVAVADVVLAKPGYGIASECVAHRTPLVTIDRPDFRETDLLRRDLARLGPCGEMTLIEFFEGRWANALGEALDSSTPWAASPSVGRPDDEVAQLLLKALDRV